MRLYQVIQAFETIEEGLEGAGYEVHVYMRSGNSFIGAAHRPVGETLRLDQLSEGGRPIFLDIHNIEAIERDV